MSTILEAVAPLDVWPLVGQTHFMAFALADDQKQFIARMIRSGRFNNQSEVVREALRRMAAAELDFLTPPPMTPAQVQRIYGPNAEEDERECRFGHAAFQAVRRAARKGARR